MGRQWSSTGRLGEAKIITKGHFIHQLTKIIFMSKQMKTPEQEARDEFRIAIADGIRRRAELEEYTHLLDAIKARYSDPLTCAQYLIGVVDGLGVSSGGGMIALREELNFLAGVLLEKLGGIKDENT